MSEPSQEAHGIRLDSKWQFLWIFYQCSTNVRLEIFIGWRHWMRKWVYGGIGGGWQGAEPWPQFLTKLQKDKYLRIQKKTQTLGYLNESVGIQNIYGSCGWWAPCTRFLFNRSCIWDGSQSIFKPFHNYLKNRCITIAPEIFIWMHLNVGMWWW